MPKIPRHAPSPGASRERGVHYLLGVLLLAVALALAAEMPWLTPVVRTRLLQGVTLGLLCVLAVSGGWQDDLRVAARRGPNPLLLALLAWCALSLTVSPYRAYAAAEMLRVLLCAGVYFTAAYGLRADQLRPAVGFVLCGGVGIALYGFIEFGTRGGSAIEGVFGNHENLGSFLMVLLPVALALALDRAGEERGRIGAQAAAVVLGGALLLARTRSAWIGGAVALVTLSLLFARFAPVRLTARNRYLVISPLLIVAAAFALLIGMGQIAPLVSARAATLARVQDDGSFTDRLHRWRAACRMASERPLTGWGLGIWPVVQGRWTHQGDDAPQVLARGTGHSNLAHNFWVQWAAETGVVGLTLYVGVFVAFLLSAVRALPTVPSGFRRTLLMGCIAAVTAACVDGLGAPSYNLPGVSVLPWLWMGIGIAACREGQPGIPALLHSRPGTLIASTAAGLAAALLVLGIGYKQRLDGRSVPRGTFTVTAAPSGPVPSDARVLWTATYRDADGRALATSPGTVWRTEKGDLGSEITAIYYQAEMPALSGWQGVVRGNASVAATATYWDDFGRRYEGSALVIVRTPTSK